MKRKHHQSYNALIFILLWTACQAALAGKPVKVISADPAESFQDRTEVVTITGSGFDTRDGAVTAINFLLPCTTDPCTTETGGVTVEPENWVVNSTEEIVATVKIDVGAKIDSRDIEVRMTRGRGGKGTTLFKVWSADACDRDGDGWLKDSQACDKSGYEGIDCNDQDPDVQACEPPDGGAAFTEVNIRVGYVDAQSLLLLEEASPYTGNPEHPFGDGWINWDTNTLTEVPRPCRVLQSNNGPGAGRYDCFEDASNGSQWPHGGRVSLPISNFSWQPAQPPKRGWKNPELCNLLAQFDDLTFGATRYQIHFTQGCTSGSDGVDCPMHVQIASYSGASSPGDKEVVQLHDFHDWPGYPDIGRLNVRGVVDQQSILFPPASGNETNVFTENQELVIEQIQVAFESVKNGALLANCETVPGTLGGLEFWTWPEPYAPQ